MDKNKLMDCVTPTEEYLKIEILIILITVPYGSPYWDFFFIIKLSLD